jgi:hypothetical protein
MAMRRADADPAAGRARRRFALAALCWLAAAAGAREPRQNDTDEAGAAAAADGGKDAPKEPAKEAAKDAPAKAPALKLHVSIVGEDKPVSGADVQLRPVQGGSGDRMQLTNSAGVAVFAGLPPGEYTLRVIAKEWKTDRRQVRVKDADGSVQIRLQRND